MGKATKANRRPARADWRPVLAPVPGRKCQTFRALAKTRLLPYRRLGNVALRGF